MTLYMQSDHRDNRKERVEIEIVQKKALFEFPGSRQSASHDRASRAHNN